MFFPSLFLPYSLVSKFSKQSKEKEFKIFVFKIFKTLSPTPIRHPYNTMHKSRIMEEQDKDMDKMRQDINNFGEQVSKILVLLSAGKGKVVVETTQSSNPVQDTDNSIYPPGFTSCHMNVLQSQTTQHYVAMNPLFVVPPPIPDIEQLEARAKIQDMGQNENTPAKQKLDVFEERLRAIEGTDVYGNIDVTQLCLVPDLIIPTKFKVPEFDKYDGSSCPKSHLIMYCIVKR